MLADLIHLMAKDLKISFSKTDITQPSYYPLKYELNEIEQQQIRTLLLQLLKNERSININSNTSAKPSAFSSFST